jgi:hypothetical protein
MDIETGSDGCLHLDNAPYLNFGAGRKRDCTTCANDPTYEELKQGITCKSVKECINNKQWRGRRYKKCSSWGAL